MPARRCLGAVRPAWGNGTQGGKIHARETLSIQLVAALNSGNSMFFNQLQLTRQIPCFASSKPRCQPREGKTHVTVSVVILDLRPRRRLVRSLTVQCPALPLSLITEQRDQVLLDRKLKRTTKIDVAISDRTDVTENLWCEYDSVRL